MTQDWWSKFCMEKQNTSPPRSLYASFALLVRIPLIILPIRRFLIVSKRVVHREWAKANPHLTQDREFWDRVDERYKVLVQEHGADRESIASTWPMYVFSFRWFEHSA
jgi:hypothetical protein